ncbi:HD domain-containing protein [Micromonospora aurantiaca]|uniref:HD domain-containing protein n=1 Tax=Micromonospora aurantiaca (nom. illeg.) TaxID=47850 RepID=UPI000E0575B6|nr:HD domain-containing protein [Micromonospora provocatoris]RBJ08673.1 phosphohydrolase [Micromonospora provocatoris]
MDQVVRAATLVEQQLAAALPRRWQHVQAVAAKARQLGQLMPSESETLIAAAWLHDVGYAPSVMQTGFHSLDGARWALAQGFGMRLSSLVAHHSCATFEADERGLGDVLRQEFPQERSPLADALWFADMTTGPDGQDLTAEERLAEIRQRYGQDHLVTRFWRKAEPSLMEAVRRTEARLAGQPM